MKGTLENSLDARYTITKMAKDAWVSYTADKNVAWVADLLREMNEHATTHTSDAHFANSVIHLSVELSRKYKGEIGEYVLARGTIRATYDTECVRTLQPMQESLTAEFKTCFVPTTVTQSEEYAETGEIWLDGDTWDMYAYEKNQIDVSEMIHEQAFLNYNYYPRLDADGPLDADLPSDKSRQ